MKAYVPRTPSQVSQPHLGLQVLTSKDYWMAIWAKWSPFSLPTKAPFELKYLCGQKYGKQCCAQAKHQPESRETTLPAPPPGEQNREAVLVPQSRDGTSIEPSGANKAEEEADEVDEDTYVAPDGQGCFSFRQSLLLRAKDTYAARCTGNKYEIIFKWLLTGLAVVLSRPNWQLLAKRGTLTATPHELLQPYYQIGYPTGLKDKTVLPYALPMHNAISLTEWQRRVGWFCHSRYLYDMDALYAERAGSSFAAFYGTMDLTKPIKAMTYDHTEAVQEQDEQPEQTDRAQQAKQAK